MAGGVEQKSGYKVANFIEEKSWVVGAVALVASVIAPALLGVAAWEGAQIVAAREYKRRVKAKSTDMKPGKQYSLAA